MKKTPFSVNWLHGARYILYNYVSVIMRVDTDSSHFVFPAYCSGWLLVDNPKYLRGMQNSLSEVTYFVFDKNGRNKLIEFIVMWLVQKTGITNRGNVWFTY